MVTPLHRALGDYPFVTVRIACHDCDRLGCYRLTGLVARHGCNITLFELLERLVTDCWRWHYRPGDPGWPCGATFIDKPFEEERPGPPSPPKLRVIDGGLP